MRTSPRVIGAAACGVALLVSGCTSGAADPDEGVTESAAPVATSSPSASSSPSDDASPSASATPDDPFAVPDPVTEEYVDRVVNTLYEEWGAITREILQEPADPAGITDVDTRERIATLFDGEYLQRRLEEADGVWRGDRGNLRAPDDFSAVTWRTRKLFVADHSCIVAAGDFDTAGTAVESRSILTTVSLRPASSPAEEGQTNQTGWTILDAQSNTGTDGEVFEDDAMLEATLEDFGDLLTTACEEA